MSDYERTFEARGHLYNEGTRLCPRARETERRLLIELLDCHPGQLVGDLPAGGGYLGTGLREVVGDAGGVVCLDPSPVFAAGIAPGLLRAIAAPEALALTDASLDHVASLAALHHLDDKQPYVEEMFRVLRPRGRFAVAEARVDSPTARFLNGAVDRMTETGHAGRFVAEGELAARLAEAGFVEVSERYHEFTWDFPDHATMVRYCYLLFGLVKARPDEVARVLESELGVIEDARGSHLRWSLVYAVGTKVEAGHGSGRRRIV